MERDVPGTEVDRIAIAVRIIGDSLDPERLTRMLGVAPTLAKRKGEPAERDGATIEQRTGIWSYALPASPEWELGDAIRTLLEQLPSDPALWESLAMEFSTDVFCALFLDAPNRLAILPVETLALLAERRLQLTLDLFGEDRGGR